MKSNIKNKKGFTLIELLAVIIILAIIMIIAIPTILGIINRARDDSARRTAEQMARAASIAMSTRELAATTVPGTTCFINFVDLDMENNSDPWQNNSWAESSGVQVAIADNGANTFTVYLISREGRGLEGIARERLGDRDQDQFTNNGSRAARATTCLAQD